MPKIWRQQIKASQEEKNISNTLGSILNQAAHMNFGVEWDSNTHKFWLEEENAGEFIEKLANRSTQVAAIGKLSNAAVVLLQPIMISARKGILTAA